VEKDERKGGCEMDGMGWDGMRLGGGNGHERRLIPARIRNVCT